MVSVDPVKLDEIGMFLLGMLDCAPSWFEDGYPVPQKREKHSSLSP